MDPWSYGMMTLHNLITATGTKICQNPLLAFQPAELSSIIGISLHPLLQLVLQSTSILH